MCGCRWGRWLSTRGDRRRPARRSVLIRGGRLVLGVADVVAPGGVVVLPHGEVRHDKGGDRELEPVVDRAVDEAVEIGDDERRVAKYRRRLTRLHAWNSLGMPRRCAAQPTLSLCHRRRRIGVDDPRASSCHEFLVSKGHINRQHRCTRRAVVLTCDYRVLRSCLTCPRPELGQPAVQRTLAHLGGASPVLIHTHERSLARRATPRTRVNDDCARCVGVQNAAGWLVPEPVRANPRAS